MDYLRPEADANKHWSSAPGHNTGVGLSICSLCSLKYSSLKTNLETRCPGNETGSFLAKRYHCPRLPSYMVMQS